MEIADCLKIADYLKIADCSEIVDCLEIADCLEKIVVFFEVIKLSLRTEETAETFDVLDTSDSEFDFVSNDLFFFLFIDFYVIY